MAGKREGRERARVEEDDKKVTQYARSNFRLFAVHSSRVVIKNIAYVYCAIEWKHEAKKW